MTLTMEFRAELVDRRRDLSKPAVALTTVLSNLRPVSEMEPSERLCLHEAVDAAVHFLALSSHEKCVVRAGMTWWAQGKSFRDGVDLALIGDFNVTGNTVQ